MCLPKAELIFEQRRAFASAAPSWFELSVDGKNFVAAEAVIKGNTVEVSSAQAQNPSFVRMGWYDIALPNLSDKNGWPVFSFPAQKAQ